jgi:hypothetical protein
MAAAAKVEIESVKSVEAAEVVKAWAPIFVSEKGVSKPGSFQYVAEPFLPREPMPDEMRDEMIRLWKGSYSTTTFAVQKSSWPRWRLLEHSPLCEDDDPAGSELDGKGQMDANAFYAWYDRHACTDWAKMDRDGNSYASESWKRGDANAWALTQRDNGLGLFELPFPHPVVFAAKSFLCSQRCESVKDVRFLCQWLQLFLPLVGDAKKVPPTPTAEKPLVANVQPTPPAAEKPL